MFFETIGFLISQYWIYLSIALVIGILTGWMSYASETHK